MFGFLDLGQHNRCHGAVSLVVYLQFLDSQHFLGLIRLVFLVVGSVKFIVLAVGDIEQVHVNDLLRTARYYR